MKANKCTPPVSLHLYSVSSYGPVEPTEHAIMNEVHKRGPVVCRCVRGRYSIMWPGFSCSAQSSYLPFLRFLACATLVSLVSLVI